MCFNDGKFPIAYSTNSPFTKKLELPRSKRVKRGLSKLAAERNREWHNGRQPISGLFTLVGKAEQLPYGHTFRSMVARLIRRRRLMRDGIIQ